MHRHRALKFLSLIAGVAALTCSAVIAEAKTQLRFFVAAYSGATQAIAKGMAKDFMAAHPDVSVKIEMIAWDKLQQRLTTDIAGNTAPDIAIIGTRWLVDYVKKDIAEPLDSYVTPEFKDRFIESFLQPSTLGGKLYGLPIAASARALYFNKDLLAKAGVNEPPATWDALVDAAKKVKALGAVNTYGFALQGKELETDAYYYYSLWSHGGEIFENGKSGLSTQAAIDALTLYKSMIDEGLTEPNPTALNRQGIERLFKTGHVGMLVSGPWLRGQIKSEAPKLKYGIAVIPAGSTKATYAVTDSVMLFKSSKVKEVAWQFLSEVAFSPKWRIAFTTKEGFLPVTKAEGEQPMFANDTQVKAFTDMLSYAHFAPQVAK